MFVPKTEEIRKRRLKANLSRKELSYLAGIANNAIFRIETGRTKQTIPIRAKAIADALHCKVEDIFTETKGA